VARIYVTGHRNPDTDSIAAAIGYAELKARLDPRNDYVPVRLGPLVVMGSRRHVLARLVVPSAALLALHRTVARAMDGAADVSELVRVDRWTPHVTLAHGLTAEQVGEALAVLGPLRGVDGSIETVRRWDPVARRTWPVSGIPTMGP